MRAGTGPAITSSLPEPAVLIAEIHEEMRAIVRQLADIAAGLGVDLAEEDPTS